MPILDLLIPSACSGCGAFGEVLCARCAGSFRPAGAPRDRFVAADPGVVVGDALEVAVAAFRYESVLRRALSHLKYGGASRLAKPLALAAAPLLQPLAAQHPSAVLVPVPVHADRLRQRGYNQAALIARDLGRTWGLPVTNALVRIRPTSQQHRLNRAERLRNLRDAFALRSDARAPPLAILIDDILTTSATLEACASVLRGASAKRVVAMAVAREV